MTVLTVSDLIKQIDEIVNKNEEAIDRINATAYESIVSYN
jgi:hypothetical protein